MPNKDAVDLWGAFIAAHQVVSEKLEAGLEREHGLSLASFEVLAHLASAPGSRMRMQDLAEKILLSKSGLTRLCDRMEGAGLIQRASCPSDRRGTYAVLTDTGANAHRSAAPAFTAAVNDRFGRHLGAAERRVLRDALRRLAEANGGGSCDRAV